MLERGDTALQLSLEIERSFTAQGYLTDTDRDKLQTVEKTAKKIRGELGGNDNDESIREILGPAAGSNVAGAVSSLKAAATELCEELKKTSRFSISAAAIETSNSVIKIANFLRARK